MKTITLPLKRKWFNMIASGEKTEEYRERNPYWHKRLNKSYDTVTFTNGYPKRDDTSRRITFKIEALFVGYGKPEWGAEEGQKYFVIKLGEKL